MSFAQDTERKKPAVIQADLIKKDAFQSQLHEYIQGCNAFPIVPVFYYFFKRTFFPGWELSHIVCLSIETWSIDNFGHKGSILS